MALCFFACLALVSVNNFVAALAPGLYGIEGFGNIVTSRVRPDGSVEQLANRTAGVAIASNLVSLPTVNGTVFALVLSTLSSRVMSVVEVELGSAALLRTIPTPLPVEEVVGLGNEVAYIPGEHKVVMVGNMNASDPTSPHGVGVLDVATQAWTWLASIPATRYWTFLGNFAGFSPTSRTFYFQLRNYTTASQAAVFVNVDTGKVVIRTGCETDNAAYDPQSDSFISVGVYRNGTTIADVWRAQMSIPADGSGDCTTGAVLYSEAGADGEDYVSISAFDTDDRTYYIYGGTIDGPAALVAVGWDAGRVTFAAPPAAGQLPATLLFLP